MANNRPKYVSLECCGTLVTSAAGARRRVPKRLPARPGRRPGDPYCGDVDGASLDELHQMLGIG